VTLRRYITDFVGDKGKGTCEGNRQEKAVFSLTSLSALGPRLSAFGNFTVQPVLSSVGEIFAAFLVQFGNGSTFFLHPSLQAAFVWRMF
jgi:uncharacterized protein YktB (UPF0637 family)